MFNVSKGRSKPIVDSDSDSDSDEDVASEDLSSDEDQSDVDSSKEIDSNSGADISSSLVQPLTVPEGTNVKTVLAKAIRDLKSCSYRCTEGVKRVPWDRISIDGYSTEDLKKELQEILNIVSHIRTLDELLADYLKNQPRYNRKMHPDCPKVPVTAPFLYLCANREKLTKLAEQSNNSKPVTSHFLTQFAMEKFKNLPEKERAKYRNEHEENMAEFRAKMDAFQNEHPEMASETRKIKKRLEEKKARIEVKKELAHALTPFSHYREEMSKNKSETSYLVLRRMWREMPSQEKGKYVAEVVNMKTDREKKIIKSELLMMDLHMGFPSRPLPPFMFFERRFKQTYEGKTLRKDATAAFNALDDTALKELNRECKVNKEKWKHEMHAYILTLPNHQHSMMFSKYKLYPFIEKQRKKKLKEVKIKKIEQRMSRKTKPSKKSRKKDFSDDDDDDQPTKKKPRQVDSTDEDSQSSPKKTKKIIANVVATTPKKNEMMIKENGVKSLPKKLKVEEPEFPSQTTAHFFMTKIHEGTPNKTAKAYKKLDRQVKGKYRTEMRKSRQEFLKKMPEYIKTLNPFEIAAYQAKIKAMKAEQTKQIEWHIDQGTDLSSFSANSSSSESSSDSS